MKKISTLYKKDPQDLGKVINEVNPENAWVFTDEGVKATRKFDGIASAIIDGELYKRRDVKKGKQIPAGAIECQAPDTITGHHPHWIKCDRKNKEDALFFEGYDNLESKEDGTYELCGEKVSTERFHPVYNREKVEGHRLIKHGAEDLDLTLRIYDFNDFRNYLSQVDIEGIVFHHPDGRMCKLRKSDYGIKR